MKNLNARKLLFLFVIVASICSYTYMNVAETNTEMVYGTEEELEMFEEEIQKDAILPDVRILQKVIQTGRRFLPATR